MDFSVGQIQIYRKISETWLQCIKLGFFGNIQGFTRSGCNRRALSSVNARSISLINHTIRFIAVQKAIYRISNTSIEQSPPPQISLSANWWMWTLNEWRIDIVPLNALANWFWSTVNARQTHLMNQENFLINFLTRILASIHYSVQQRQNSIRIQNLGKTIIFPTMLVELINCIANWKKNHFPREQSKQ